MLGQKSQLSGESFREKLLPKENLTLQRTRNTRNIFGKRAKPFAGQKSTFYRQAYFLKGLLGCIGGLMIHLVIGSLYQWGTLSPYVTSYFKLHGHEGLTLRNMAVLFPIMMFCIGVTMKAGLDMGEKYGYHRVLIGNYFFCFIFVWCSSYLTNLFGKPGPLLRIHSLVCFWLRPHGRYDFCGAHEGLQCLLPQQADLCQWIHPYRDRGGSCCLWWLLY